MPCPGFRRAHWGFGVVVAVLLVWAPALVAQTPAYRAIDLVNAASNAPTPLSPGTIATLYGTNLAYTTRQQTADDITANTLPATLPGTGVRVFISNQPAHVYYVSPTQINLVIPVNLPPGQGVLDLLLDGRRGPTIPVVLMAEAPEFFLGDGRFIAATNAANQPLTPDRVAQPGDVVVLYATGLGRTTPSLLPGQLASQATSIARLPELRLQIEGRLVEAESILYAGLSPGFAGLYQINVRLPLDTPANPEIRLGFENITSQPGTRLRVRR
ncbi:MAG: hypothetical protein NTV70_21365 [Acidobacteria bacterium]|nr:hypothetical protein [Acidobacteriota bacterium]